MHTTIYSSALLIIALTIACATDDGLALDAEIVGDADILPGPGADYPELETSAIDCTDDGRCWVTCSSWSSWAQTITDEGMAAVLAVAEPVDGDCFRFDAGGHLCFVEADCATLVGRPVTEVTILPGSCTSTHTGPWSWTVADQHGCLGVIDGVAVALLEG